MLKNNLLYFILAYVGDFRACFARQKRLREQDPIAFLIFNRYFKPERLGLYSNNRVFAPNLFHFFCKPRKTLDF